MANQPARPGYGSAAAAGARSQEPGAPAAAGPRAGGCAWGWARVLVRVLVDPDGVLVMSARVLVRVLV